MIIISFIDIYTIFSIYIYNYLKNDLETAFYETHENNVGEVKTALEDWVCNQVDLARSIASQNSVIELCIDPSNESARLKNDKFLMDIYENHTYFQNIGISPVMDKSYTIEVDGEIQIIESGKIILLQDLIGANPEITLDSLIGRDKTGIYWV